jgi:hypothetical protein
MAKMTAREILEGAKALLKEHGWCKHNLSNSEGKHCAVGAMFLVATGSAGGPITERHQNYRTLMLARNTLANAVPGDCGTIGFNDNPETTKKDVLALFDKALRSRITAKRARAKGTKR